MFLNYNFIDTAIITQAVQLFKSTLIKRTGLSDISIRWYSIKVRLDLVKVVLK